MPFHAYHFLGHKVHGIAICNAMPKKAVLPDKQQVLRRVALLGKKSTVLGADAQPMGNEPQSRPRSLLRQHDTRRCITQHAEARLLLHSDCWKILFRDIRVEASNLETGSSRDAVPHSLSQLCNMQLNTCTTYQKPDPAVLHH